MALKHLHMGHIMLTCLHFHNRTETDNPQYIEHTHFLLHLIVIHVSISFLFMLMKTVQEQKNGNCGQHLPRLLQGKGLCCTEQDMTPTQPGRRESCIRSVLLLMEGFPTSQLSQFPQQASPKAAAENIQMLSKR